MVKGWLGRKGAKGLVDLVDCTEKNGFPEVHKERNNLLHTYTKKGDWLCLLRILSFTNVYLEDIEGIWRHKRKGNFH